MEIRGEPVDHIVRLKEYPSVSKSPVHQQTPNLFVYCSTPRPISDVEVSGGRFGRPLYRNNTEKPVGVHSYYNLGWDPRVKRGDPLQARKIKEQQECEKIRRKLLEPRKKTGKSSKLEKSQVNQIDPQAMIRAANMRYARLAISNLRQKEKDAFLQELTDELDQDELCYMGTRIGAAKILPKVPSRKRTLKEKACQIWPGDFFDFDREVVPIIERLVGSVCYQARLEVLQETEQEAREREREIFEEEKRKEEYELRKFKARVLRHVQEEQRQQDLARKQHQDEIDGKTSVSLYAGVYVKFNTEDGFNAMGEEWQTQMGIKKLVETEVVDWINEQVEDRLRFYDLSYKLLDDIIHQVVSEREAECAAAMWKEVYGEEPLPVFTQDSNLVPPPTPGTSAYLSEEEENPLVPDPTQYSFLSQDSQFI